MTTLLLLLLPLAALPSVSAWPPAAPPRNASFTQTSFLPTSFDYTYVDLAWLRADEDVGLDERDGFLVRGSYDMTDNIRLLGSFADSQGDHAAGEDEVREYTLGFGLHGTYSDRLDLIADFEWLRREFHGLREGRHKGWQAAVGVRALPLDWLELDAAAIYRNAVDDDVGGRAGIVLHTGELLGVRATGSIIGDETRFTAGLRFSP